MQKAMHSLISMLHGEPISPCTSGINCFDAEDGTFVESRYFLQVRPPQINEIAFYASVEITIHCYSIGSVLLEICALQSRLST